MSESADRANEKPNAPSGLNVGASVRVSRLDEIKLVRAELGRLYREARRRHGRFPDALTAQRLANVLASMRTMIEVEDLERRISAIEEASRAP